MVIAAGWLLAGLVLGGWTLWHAPLVAVRIDGNHDLDEAQVLRAAGLHAGVALRAVDPFETARRLAAHPRIKRADVRRLFPGRAIVTVREREPLLRLVLPDGREAAIDEDGMVLALHTGGSDEVDLPRVRGLATVPRTGELLRDPVLDRVREVLAAFAAAGLPTAGLSLDASRSFLFTARLPDGRRLLVPPDHAAAALRTYREMSEKVPELLGSNEVDLQALGPDGAGRVVLRSSR